LKNSGLAIFSDEIFAPATSAARLEAKFKALAETLEHDRIAEALRRLADHELERLYHHASLLRAGAVFEQRIGTDEQIN
jgi:hypothetical protein